MTAARRSRVLAGLADQMLYSLSNFIVTLQVARHATAAQFGIFSLMMAAMLVASAVNRGLAAEPVIVRHSAADLTVWRRVIETKLCLALVFGEVLGLVALEVTRALPHSFGNFGLMFALAPAVVFTQDLLRYAAIAAARPGDAVLNDLTVVVVQVTLGVLIGALSDQTPVVAVGIWVGATACGAIVGLARLRLAIRVPTLADLRADGGLAARFGLDNFVTQLSQQGVGYAVGAAAGLAAAGGFRAAQTVYMPMSVLLLGVQAAVIPELVRARERSPHSLRVITLTLGAAVAAGFTVYAVVASLLPDSLGRAVFGASWSQAAPLILVIGIASGGGGLAGIAMIGLRAMADATRTLRARWVSVVLTVGCVLPGAAVGGARGAAIGLIVASWAMVGLWWRQLFHSWRSSADVTTHGRTKSISRETLVLQVAPTTAEPEAFESPPPAVQEHVAAPFRSISLRLSRMEIWSARRRRI